MIISHTHRFLFLKSLKTAGTSIEAALSQHCSGDDVVTPLNDFAHNRDETGGIVHRAMNADQLPWWDKETIGQHVDAATMRANLPPEVWAGYVKFSIARNPWDRMVSMFTWLKRNNASLKPRKGLAHRLGLPFDEMAQVRQHFRDFIRAGVDTNDRFYFLDGQLCADFMVRYEHLGDDLSELCRRLSLPPLALPNLKAGFRPHKYSYAQYYDDETRSIVAESHRRDIEQFGYAFESARSSSSASPA